MVISSRLTTIASMVTKGHVLIDVGTDHGYLPIYLIEQGQIEKAIAMDINKGPLARAKAHIEEHGLLQYIETRLSDGVATLKENEGDTLVIAGMGGNLVIKILREGCYKLSHIKEFILQPQSELYGVRKYLQENGYCITNEHMMIEEDKYYTIIKVVKGQMQPYSDVFLKYGKELLKRSDSILYQYLMWEKKMVSTIQKDLEHTITANTIQRLEEIKQALLLMEEALQFYQ